MNRGWTIIGCAVLVPFFFSRAEARSKKNLPSPALAASNPADSFWQSDLNESSAAPANYVGMVSWYGGGFHGRKTASGERFNMHQLTCASRNLPFGTLLEVTNLTNGQKAVVRVNDRGPFVRSRILDVSKEAAKQLGFIGQGSTRAELRVLGAEETVAAR